MKETFWPQNAHNHKITLFISSFVAAQPFVSLILHENQCDEKSLFPRIHFF